MTPRKTTPDSTTVRVTARRLAAPDAPAVGVPAKLRPPKAHLRCVEQHTLLEALTAAHEPLVLMCAPAGTGKTTALRRGARPAAGPRLGYRSMPRTTIPSSS